jgi:transposase InsO family protein
MNIHKNARLTVCRRQELVGRLEGGEPLKRLARVFAVSARTARKWRTRYREEGAAGLMDRSSRPLTSPGRTPARLQLAAKVLRRQQWTCREIAGALEVSASTVARVLRRCGLARRGRLTPPPVAQRYEHAAVGDLLHLDSKKLGRIRGLGHRMTGQRFHHFSGAGWEYLHVAVDDHSRVAYVDLLPDEGQGSARRFLRGALRWFRAHGVRVRRILTDNGSAYRSRSFRAACRALRVSHRRTRPYTPRTNGKAERFIQTALREWAYRRPYYTSADRGRVLPGWLEHYNCARPHTSLNRQPPMSRFPRGNNLMLLHT